MLHSAVTGELPGFLVADFQCKELALMTFLGSGLEGLPFEEQVTYPLVCASLNVLLGAWRCHVFCFIRLLHLYFHFTFLRTYSHFVLLLHPSISAASLVLRWSCTLGDDGPRVIGNDHDVAWWRPIHVIRILRDEDS